MPLKVLVTAKVPASAEGVVIPAWRGKVVEGVNAEELTQRGFTQEWGTAELLLSSRKSRLSFVAVVGLGDFEAPVAHQAEGMRRGIARVVSDARRHALRELAVIFSSPAFAKASSFAKASADTSAGKFQETVVYLSAAALEGAEMANYRFTEYLPTLAKEQQGKAVRTLTLVVPQTLVRTVQETILITERIMKGTVLARDLVNRPASAVSPAYLVHVAKEIAKTNKGVEVTILDKEKIEEANMQAFLAVARGSREEPYVIHLRYVPSGKAKRKVAVIGKGVTFDSGGLSLKPAEAMEYMKCDMAGAASVLGLFAVIGDLAPAVEVHGIMAVCENMPSGAAYRPGDVLWAKNGKTIEVLNTDAEGRITLADALDYALEQKPDALIDVATLTGSCLVGLGETVAGLWGNNADLKEQLLRASAATGEQLNAMPLPEELRPLIASRVADIKNIASSKWGGAITAALFLREFVGTTPWAHIDIAGPSWAERLLLPYYEYGGTGFGVRLLAEFLRQPV